MIGYINLHRKLISWEWYNDHNTTRLFIHLLLIASHKPHQYRGVTIETGQVMTGYDKLSYDTGLSVQNIRTGLKRLKSTSELTIKSSPQGTIIQLVNYSKYQTPTSKVTSNQQTSNKQVTTINNDNNVINKEDEFKNSLIPFINTYGADMLNAFYLYWTEKNTNGKKMRFEYSKNQPFNINRRLTTWSNRQKEFTPKQQPRL